MTIQTFVENAIKHGFESRKGGGNVDIIIQMIEDKLEILIRDNGIGRSQAALQRTGGTGYGLKILNDIFEVMNTNNKNVSKISVTDLCENGMATGTEIKIFIPKDYRFEFQSNGDVSIQ